jgi:Glycosyl transferase family 2
MGELPLASILITSYNYDRFLGEAIDSALKQTYPRTQVIVVDDGSTDDSRAVVRRYGDRILSVLKANGGQASAFNAGFAVSQGEVLLFLDSDDLLLPTAVESAVRLFSDPEIVKVHWPLWTVDAHGKKTGRVVPRSPLPEGDFRAAVMHGGSGKWPAGYMWPPTSGNAWARRFIEAVFPMPEFEYKTCPDLYLSVLAALFGPMKRIADPQALWRIHGENNSWLKPFDERLGDHLQRLDHCFDVLRGHCEATGAHVDPEVWKANSGLHRIHRATEELSALIPLGESFILADEDKWETDAVIAGRRRIPFLERNGQYGGRPPDDETAIREFERLRRTGASLMVFGWPAFWWLEYYAGLNQHLRSHFSCVLQNERLVVFDLRPRAGTSRAATPGKSRLCRTWGRSNRATEGHRSPP